MKKTKSFVPGTKEKIREESLDVQQEQHSSTEKGIYKGNWKANKMHGFGVFKWASGRTYEGYWVDDVKTGVGVLNFKGGNEYAGEFFNDKREGYGYY